MLKGFYWWTTDIYSSVPQLCKIFSSRVFFGCNVRALNLDILNYLTNDTLQIQTLTRTLPFSDCCPQWGRCRCCSSSGRRFSLPRLLPPHHSPRSGSSEWPWWHEYAWNHKHTHTWRMIVQTLYIHVNNANRDCFMVCRIRAITVETYPAWPPASIWLANVTSLDQTSNCHFLRPSTPQCTLPLWIPTRMFTFTPVTSRTSLQDHRILNYQEWKSVKGLILMLLCWYTCRRGHWFISANNGHMFPSGSVVDKVPIGGANPAKQQYLGLHLEVRSSCLLQWYDIRWNNSLHFLIYEI